MRWQVRLWRWWLRLGAKPRAPRCVLCDATLMRGTVDRIAVYICPNGCGGE